MSDAGKAVFLSYASQDAEAAKRICDALRAAGVEVWFDQSELVGGDQWDAKIRGQIGSCALFVPVISANTQARLEGYFRLEWKIAALRTHTMAEEKTFLLPVLIDGTRDAEGKVPAEFKAVQWTKLPGGEATPAFSARVKALLSDKPLDVGQGRQQATSPEARTERREAKPVSVGRAGWKTYAGLGAAVVALAVAVGGWLLARPRAMHSSAPAAAIPAAPLSEAAQKLAQARAMLARDGYLNRANLEATEEVLRRALTLDPTEADAWALAARVDSYLLRQGYDRSETRRQQAFDHAGKAISLAPEGWEPRLAKALVLLVAGNTPATKTEAEELYRTLLRERPDDRVALMEAAAMLKEAGKPAEAARLLERMGDPTSAGWCYVAAGEFAEARRVVDDELAKARTAPMLKLKIYVETMGYEDLEAARAASVRFTGTELLDDEFLTEALRLAEFRRDSKEILRLLNAFPREMIAASIFQGSKREFTGIAHHLAGRGEAARSEWRLALQQLREKSPAAGNESRSLYQAAVLHAWLGETTEAQQALERARGLLGLAADQDSSIESGLVESALGHREAALANLERNLLSRKSMHAFARFDWTFDSLRGDPRFEQLLRDHRPPTAKPFDEAQGRPFDEAQGRPFDEPKSQTLDPGSIDRPAIDQKSIAVLPFTNMSEDKDSGYFADGVQEDILTNLGNLRELRVVSRTSVMSYRDSKKSLRQIAQELGVAFVLEGSVRRAGGKVRITSQLIRAATDEHVWAKNYDRDLTDVFAIQSELAQAIAGELKVAISPQEKNLLERRPTENLAAYDLYLKADEITQREGLTPVAYQKAESLLQSAVELDPGFVKAWSRLSSYQSLVYFSGFNHTAGQLAKAKASLDAVVRLAPDSPEALWTAGSYYHRTREFARALGYFDRLAALQPNSAGLANIRALILQNQGKMAESLSEFRRALQLEPPTPGRVGNFKNALVAVRRYDEAFAMQRQLVALRANAPQERAQLAHLAFLATGSRQEMEALVASLPPSEANSPRWIDLRRTYAQSQGDLAEAIRLDRLQPYFDGDGVEHWQQAVSAALALTAQGDEAGARARLENFPAEIRARLELEPKDESLWLGLAYMEWLLGRPAEALRCARQAVALVPPALDALNSTGPTYALAFTSLANGDKERALALLEQLLRTPGGLNVHEFRTYAGWNSLHGDPRFEALLSDPKNNAPLF